MFNVPLDDLKEKIREQSGLSAADLAKKISDKMESLSGLVSEEGACHILANELGVQITPPEGERKVKDLLPGMRDVQQDMRVLSIYELRTFTTKAGAEGKVISILSGDETGKIRCVFWGSKADEAGKLKAEDTIRVTKGLVRENNGRAELHLNDKSDLLVNPEGVEVKMPETSGGGDASYVEKKINELSQGDYRVQLMGTVVQVYDPRFFTRKDGREGAVLNMLIDDGTGNIRCGCFDDQAAAVLQIPLEDVMKRKGESFEEERTNALGLIAKVEGRVKLNTLYNSLEMTSDSIDMHPSPSDSQSSLAEKKVVEETPEESVSIEEVEEAPVEKKESPAADVVADSTASKNVFDDVTEKKDDDLPSLDDLDDLDLDDI